MLFLNEDLYTAALMFEKGEDMFKFDLKSGYHHINMCTQTAIMFLGFQ